MTTKGPNGERRRYDSPVRRQQAAETRERIVLAGAELMHGSPVWDWRTVTIRRVAELAGVNERTVYRHFANERELRDAVIERLEREAGVDLEGVTLDALGDHAARVLEYVSTFPLEQRAPLDPTLASTHRRLQESLLGAVAPYTTSWSETDRTLAAALLDVLWSVTSYERLVFDWGVEAPDAIRAVRWAIGLVEDAVRAGDRPTPREV